MRVLRALALILPACCFLGCNETHPGGPNATKPREEKTVGEKTRDATGIGTSENTFKISLPTFETGIKQGEKKTVKISISRGKNFDQDVKLDFGKLPTGVSASPVMPTIKHGENDTEVNFEAAKDAAVGDHTVTVTAKPTEGASTTGEMKIGVKKP
jgi:uncharacterized membrane protein